MNLELNRFEAEALHEAIEDRLSYIDEDQERDRLLSLRARIEELIRADKCVR